ncbi:MAG: 3-methyl-2-oxobutanoate hydroxymethyltransferase [Verrucomicrobiales bacterium]
MNEPSLTSGGTQLHPGVHDFRMAKLDRRPMVVLTAGDYPTARTLDTANLDAILVGDSLGMTLLGYPDTTEVTLTVMEHHTRAVARGATQTFLIADLPIDTYNSPQQALDSSRVLLAAGAHAVKLEGAHSEIISTLTKHDIPVMAHLGMLPQSVKLEGGYKKKGTTVEDRHRLLQEAKQVEAAGAFAVVLELVNAASAQVITQELNIPTIGIGSGPNCDGQVLVTYDLAGAFPWFRPPFAPQYGQAQEQVQRAVERFISEVRSGAFPLS